MEAKGRTADWLAGLSVDPRDLPWSAGRWEVVDSLERYARRAEAAEQWAMSRDFLAMARVVARCDPEYFAAMARLAKLGL